MWPGNSYVDWVAWDPYNFASCGKKPWHNFDQTVRPFYDWLEANSFGAKPFMLAEYGTIEGSDTQHGKASWLNGVASALQSLPNLHALVYFDLPAPPANCNWQISTSPAATRAFGVLARSAPFQQSATQSPLGR
jgi:beta-mannanase